MLKEIYIYMILLKYEQSEMESTFLIQKEHFAISREYKQSRITMINAKKILRV